VVVEIDGEEKILCLAERRGLLSLVTDDGPCELIGVAGGRAIKIIAVVTFAIHTIPE
jgi:hypothetical protein